MPGRSGRRSGATVEGTAPGRTGAVRQYRTRDDVALSRVCIATADDGADAQGTYAHPELLAEVYALPYVRYEPDLCLVLEDADGQAAGYVLGTSDTPAFEAWLERAWWPRLRQAHPVGEREPGTADHALARLVADPPTTPPSVSGPYPASMHIDLLPHMQGGGWGRRLVDAFAAVARSAGATGVHLGVSRRNERAVGFYRALGFTELDSGEDWLRLGRSLD